MRVLVVATSPHFSIGTQLMVALAAGLSARGEVVAVATALRSDTEREMERRWPRLSVRSVNGRDWWRQALSLRGIVTALRPDALLVGSRADAVLAAFAAGKGRGIVRRFAADERGTSGNDDTLPWRARLVLARATVSAWGDDRLAIGWPLSDTPAETGGDSGAVVHHLPVTAPVVALQPGAVHDEATAHALRVLAHLRSRHPDLRVLLLGEAAALQATRVHAAALDLAGCAQVVPVSMLLGHALRQLAAVWITGPGDSGAVATLAAMQQQVPVVVPHDASFAELVTPGVTGWLAAPEGGVTTAADLARVLADATARRVMGEAAAAKAARDHGWDAFVDAAATALARSAGLAGVRITRRPALTPV